MAIIDEIAQQNHEFEIDQSRLRREFWKKFDERKDDVVLSINFVLFKKKVKLWQLRGVFVWLFGPHPETSSNLGQ